MGQLGSTAKGLVVDGFTGPGVHDGETMVPSSAAFSENLTNSLVPLWGPEHRSFSQLDSGFFRKTNWGTTI